MISAAASVAAAMTALIPASFSIGYPAPAGVARVAVIVVDDFEPGPKGPLEAPPTANCSYSPEDANVVGDQGAGDDLPAGMSHGEAVYTRLAAELTAVPGLSAWTEPVPRGDYGLGDELIAEAQAWTYEQSEVLLVGLDTAGFTTDQTAARLRAAVESMGQAKQPVTRFVLNMSFVIAPCNVPAWLKEIGRLDAAQVLAVYQGLIDSHAGLAHLQDELDELVGDTGGQEDRLLAPGPDDAALAPLRWTAALSLFYDQLLKQQQAAVMQRVHTDPLKPLLTTLNTKYRRVIPVAAAGNGVRTLDVAAGRLRHQRFAFPFAPALWNSVVSVSAAMKAEGSRAAYANSGEVMLDGRSPLAEDGLGPQLTGTSFAAPRLAAKQALYLLTGGEVACGGHLPPLGYTDSDRPGQRWDDLTVSAASAAYCPDFARRTS